MAHAPVLRRWTHGPEDKGTLLCVFVWAGLCGGGEATIRVKFGGDPQ